MTENSSMPGEAHIHLDFHIYVLSKQEEVLTHTLLIFFGTRILTIFNTIVMPASGNT